MNVPNTDDMSPRMVVARISVSFFGMGRGGLCRFYLLFITKSDGFRDSSYKKFSTRGATCVIVFYDNYRSISVEYARWITFDGCT